MCVCVFDCVTSFRRWGSGIGLTWKLCLVFMAFCALRCYLKDRAQKAASVADCRPGMSQPPDYYEVITHELELKYSFLGSFYRAVFCTQSGKALQLLKDVNVVKECRNIKRFAQLLHVRLNTFYSNSNLFLFL